MSSSTTFNGRGALRLSSTEPAASASAVSKPRSAPMTVAFSFKIDESKSTRIIEFSSFKTGVERKTAMFCSSSGVDVSLSASIAVALMLARTSA